MSETGVGYVFGETFGSRRVVYGVRDGLAVFEGDIVLGPVAEVAARSALALPEGRFRWPGGIVPYEIDPALPDAQRTAVADAVAHWNRVTRLAVVPRTSEPDYVQFVPGGGCTSMVGRQGGRQNLSLGTGCFFGQATHELGHAAGLWHEQSREDRDQFVRIVWDNVEAAQRHNFDQHITDGDDVGPYDYGSIMHYPPVSFSVNGQPTIVPLAEGVSIGQREALSAGDRAALRVLYPDLEPSFRTTWTGSFSGAAAAEVLYYLPSRRTWYLGSFAAGALTWTVVGSDGSLGLVGDFDGDGLSEVLDGSGRLGRVIEGQLSWSSAESAAPGSLSWTGRFSGDAEQVLTHSPEDGSWWLGPFDWQFAGNTLGFTADLSTLLVGDIDGDGLDELLVEDGGEWWCARLSGSEFAWSVVGPSQARAVGVTPRGLLATDADSTWLGSLADGGLTWTRVGASAPAGRLVDGRYVAGPAGVWAFDGAAWSPLGGDGADVMWAFPDGRLLSYTSVDGSCRLYSPETGWRFAATFET